MLLDLTGVVPLRAAACRVCLAREECKVLFTAPGAVMPDRTEEGKLEDGAVDAAVLTPSNLMKLWMLYMIYVPVPHTSKALHFPANASGAP